MTAALIPYEGRLRELNRMIADHSTDWRLMLFKNNLTPSGSTVYADLTEADFSGYARVTPAWGAVALDGSNRAQAVSADCTFTKSGATTGPSYGWALIDVSSGNKILAINRHPDAPFPFNDDGDFKTVTPRLTLTQAP